MALPSTSPASVVSARLCCITSKSAASPPCTAVAVRQTPSTATLAPTARPSQKPGAKARVKLRKPGLSTTDCTRAVP